MSEAQIWLQQALRDFETAEFNKKHKKLPYAAFLYQQSIEKGLKAVLIAQQKGLVKTHDCFVLAKKIDAPSKIVEIADIATPFYFRTRYPDAELVELTEDDIRRLAKAAKEVLVWIKKQF